MNIEERFQRMRPEKILPIGGDIGDVKEFLKVRKNLHPKRKNNLIVAAMFNAYEGGMSLAAIGKLYGKTRQAIYDTFRSRGYHLRSKQHKGLVRRFGISFTFDGNGVLRGSKDRKRVYLHRLVWEKKNGPIPPAHVLTFLDGNHTNVTLENLELVPMNQMSKRFNPTGRNQFSL